MAHSPLRVDSVRCNIVRLPTAAARKIKNPVRAAREYRKAQPSWPVPHLLPVQADAKALSRSPELVIALAILKALSVDQRRVAVDAVHLIAFHAGDEVSRLASQIVSRLEGGK